MANYQGHIIGAAAANTLYMGALRIVPTNPLDATNYILAEWELLLGLYVLAILFGLFPDTDTNSLGQNIFFGVAFTADILLIATGRYEAAAYLGLLSMTPIVGKHRGWTHSLWAMVLVPLPILLVPYIHNQEIWTTGLLLYGAAVTGYFSHLLLDGMVLKKIGVRHR